MGLKLAGLPTFDAFGYATGLSVAAVMAAAVTLVPALCALAGRRLLGRRGARREAKVTRTERWARTVSRRPLRWALGSLAVLIALAAASVALRSAALVWYWLLPLALGLPWLRLYLLSEHTGCSEDDDGLTNTRTTLSVWPVRFLMWNLPYHAEHHLYPSIPFHRLPATHRWLRRHLGVVGRGYVSVQRGLYAELPRSRRIV
jgi:fatty acid desaturase